MMPVPRRSPHSISHPGLRRVSRIKGRTHVSTRPRATPLLKIFLAPQGASTHVVMPGLSHDDARVPPREHGRIRRRQPRSECGSAVTLTTFGSVAMPGYSPLLDEERDHIAALKAAGRSIGAIEGGGAGHIHRVAGVAPKR